MLIISENNLRFPILPSNWPRPLPPPAAAFSPLRVPDNNEEIGAI